MILYLVLIAKALLECSIIILIPLTLTYIVISIIENLQCRYEEWKIKKRNQRWEKEHEEFMQRQRKWELEWKIRKEERRKYPLFFWKENI